MSAKKAVGSFLISLYNGDDFLGRVHIFPNSDNILFEPDTELRVSNFSIASDRCPPLVVLHVIADGGVLFKLKPTNRSMQSRNLEAMHTICLSESKTAVILLSGGSEIHLVAMKSRKKSFPCFWGFALMPRLYRSCLTMLNTRCLALVLDLDETLIVANTLKSFEDRIEALGSRLKNETDTQKLSGMTAELKRYIQDRALLRQFADNDRVWDNTSEKYVDAETELVPALATEGGSPLMRPVVRFQDSNIVFTRINPHVRDTSVLVRLRPAWEELRNYLIEKGRKRFEVFVCTMAERGYALEIWRLLDPQSQLIKESEVLQRVVCVKSGSKKSLSNVFSSGNCHPNMALVIDDRLKVWEDRDQFNVHVVPAFAPYYDPQAETNIPTPTLSVARNLACDVRGGFFRDFDEGLLKVMAEIDYEEDISSLPPPPMLSKYLIGEDQTKHQVEFIHGNKEAGGSKLELGNKKTLDAVFPKGLELRQQIKPTNLKGPLPFQHEDITIIESLHPAINFKESPDQLLNYSHRKPELLEFQELSESELDKGIWDRQLLSMHGERGMHQHKWQRNISYSPVRESLRLNESSDLEITDNWMRPEGDFCFNHSLATFPGSFYDNQDNLVDPALLRSIPPSETSRRRYQLDQTQSSEDIYMNTSPEARTNPVILLGDLAQKYKTNVEYKALLNTTKSLQFSVEVFFDGEKVGEGVGGTSNEAKYRAADTALHYMRRSNFAARFMRDVHTHGHDQLTAANHESITSLRTRAPRYFAALSSCTLAEDRSYASSSGQTNSVEFQDIQERDREYSAVAALQEYCMMEGASVVFNDISPVLASLEHHLQGFVCQIEIAGLPLGNGNGRTWEDAKEQAAEEALRRVRLGHHRRPPHIIPHRTPHKNKRKRTFQNHSNKRFFNR